jgi:hypothetical protein
LKKNSNIKLFFSNRAQTEIKNGEEITAQYLTPLVGTMERRSKIRYNCLFIELNLFSCKIGLFVVRKNWFFQCCCARCSDPTELGTDFSGIRCRKCQVQESLCASLVGVCQLGREAYVSGG